MCVLIMVRYKGISICFKMLSRCLSGRYINFGVFWLYQDKAIDEAFHMMFQLMLSIPHHDLMVRTWWGLLYNREQMVGLRIKDLIDILFRFRDSQSWHRHLQPCWMTLARNNSPFCRPWSPIRSFTS